MAEPIGSFNGIASGIQWQDMIDQIMLLERRSVTRLESRISQTNAQVTTWKSFKATVESLRDAAAQLSDGSALRQFTSTVHGLPEGAAAVVGVRADAAAQPGSVHVRTVAVARAEKLGGSTFLERDSIPGIAGELRINGRAVAISATDSLTQIAAAINAANGGSEPVGASASVLMTPAGEYRLILTSAQTGAQGLALDDDGGGMLAGLGLDTAEVIAAGTDAQLEIDGALYTNASNTFQGILEGVTFTAMRPSDVGVDVDIARDGAAAAVAAAEFVDALNALGSFVKAQTGSAPLAGHGTLRSMHNMLRGPLLEDVVIDGVDTARLSDIGIEVDRFGVYSLDRDKLAAALQTDPLRAERVLGGENGIATRVLESARLLLSSGNGSVDGIVDQLTGRIPGIENRIASLEARLDERRAALVRRFAALEQAMAQAQSQSLWLASQMSAFQK